MSVMPDKVAPPTRLVLPPAAVNRTIGTSTDRPAEPHPASSNVPKQRPFGAWLRESQQRAATPGAAAAQPGGGYTDGAPDARRTGTVDIHEGVGAEGSAADASEPASADMPSNDAKATRRSTARTRSIGSHGPRPAIDAAKMPAAETAVEDRSAEAIRGDAEPSIASVVATAVDRACRQPQSDRDSTADRSQARSPIVAATDVATGQPSHAVAMALSDTLPTPASDAKDNVALTESASFPTFPAAANVFATPAPPTPVGSNNATAHVSAHVESPQFAASLGVQVTVFAAQGVQRAELHLNPAEMGPVSIRIAIDGTSARVDFAADHAATRDAIERGLPELATALREAGLTLSGGGVSAGAGGSGESRDGDRAGGSGPPRTAAFDANRGDATSQAHGSHRVVTVEDGGVDVYA